VHTSDRLYNPPRSHVQRLQYVSHRVRLRALRVRAPRERKRERERERKEEIREREREREHGAARTTMRLRYKLPAGNELCPCTARRDVSSAVSRTEPYVRGALTYVTSPVMVAAPRRGTVPFWTLIHALLRALLRARTRSPGSKINAAP
jgi:hypothetical protein